MLSQCVLDHFLCAGGRHALASERNPQHNASPRQQYRRLMGSIIVVRMLIIFLQQVYLELYQLVNVRRTCSLTLGPSSLR